MKITRAKLRDIIKEASCWPGYSPGAKTGKKTKISPKTGKRVNNCEKISETDEENDENSEQDLREYVSKIILSESARDIEEKMRQTGADVNIYMLDDIITLSRIVIPIESRGLGIGTRAMNILINFADQNKKLIALTPSTDYGGSKGRLIKFYKKFGFVNNKGRNKDFRTRETMIRYPQ